MSHKDNDFQTRRSQQNEGQQSRRAKERSPFLLIPTHTFYQPKSEPRKNGSTLWQKRLHHWRSLLPAHEWPRLRRKRRREIMCLPIPEPETTRFDRSNPMTTLR
jgi:hypothetical protein